jgi:hypothetical protein
MDNRIGGSTEIVRLLPGLTIAITAGYGALPVLLCFWVLTAMFLGLERLLRIVVGKDHEPQRFRLPGARVMSLKNESAGGISKPPGESAGEPSTAPGGMGADPKANGTACGSNPMEHPDSPGESGSVRGCTLMGVLLPLRRNAGIAGF